MKEQVLRFQFFDTAGYLRLSKIAFSVFEQGRPRAQAEVGHQLALANGIKVLDPFIPQEHGARGTLF